MELGSGLWRPRVRGRSCDADGRSTAESPLPPPPHSGAACVSHGGMRPKALPPVCLRLVACGMGGGLFWGVFRIIESRGGGGGGRPKRPSWEKTKFILGKVWLGHFWYTNFWVPNPPSPPRLKRRPAPSPWLIHPAEDRGVLSGPRPHGYRWFSPPPPQRRSDGQAPF